METSDSDREPPPVHVPPVEQAEQGDAEALRYAPEPRPINLPAWVSFAAMTAFGVPIGPGLFFLVIALGPSGFLMALAVPLLLGIALCRLSKDMSRRLLLLATCAGAAAAPFFGHGVIMLVVGGAVDRFSAYMGFAVAGLIAATLFALTWPVIAIGPLMRWLLASARDSPPISGSGSRESRTWSRF